MSAMSSCTFAPPAEEARGHDANSARFADATTDLPGTHGHGPSSELLGMSRSAVYRAAAAGHLPTLRFGRRVYVPTARLLAMLGIDAEEEP